MAVKETLIYPDPRLKLICSVIEEFDETTAELQRDLLDTMIAAGHSVGVAAPQIGVIKRAVVVDVSKSKLGKKQKNHGLLQMINPQILERRGNQISREGCMSVPDYTGNVARAEEIVVQFIDEHQQPHVIQAEGFEAIAIQHELDHLDGYLFIDRVSSIKSDLFRRKNKS
jgi:peptide deformylase